jgi:putative ABC transport system permease protein
MSPSLRRRGRLVTALAILSLALGIGGNAVVFSLVESLLFLRLPYTDPDRVVLLGQRESDQPDVALMNLLSALPVWADFRDRSNTLTDWAALDLGFMSLSDRDRSVAVMAGSVTPSVFQVLGSRTVMGRVFAEAEGVPGGPRLAILSWDYWRTAMAADPSPLGKLLTLDGETYEVIGVMPDGYDFVTPHVDVWIPLQADPYSRPRHERSSMSLARMAPGVTMSDVAAEMDAIGRDLEARYPEEYTGWTMSATNLGTGFPDPHSRQYLTIIQIAVSFVLLITCANVANLLVVRAQDRTREIALRIVLGASRWHVIGRLARESVSMAGAGGLAGLVLTAGGVHYIGERFEAAPFVPRLFQPQLDGDAVAFVGAVTLVCGLLVGVLPALQSFKIDQVEALKSGGASGSTRRSRVAGALVSAQTALSLVALGGGAVMTRGFLDVMGRDPGFEIEPLLTVGLDVPSWKYDLTEGADLLDRLRERAAADLDVEAAALAMPLPKNLVVSRDTFRVSGVPVDEGVGAPRAIGVRVSAGFLEAFGVPLLQGRFVEGTDRAESDPVAVVNQAFAQRRFPGGSPLGARVTFLGASRAIVGVVGDVQQGLVPGPDGAADETIYVPFAQVPRGAAYLALRARGDPRELEGPVREVVRAIDSDLTVNTVETMREYSTRYTASLDLFNVILGAFGILALLLASLGTYGVVAYTVGQRTHEVGVRLAVGARAGQVVTLIATSGLKMTVFGLAVGGILLTPVLAVVERVMEGFRLEPAEPATLAIVVLVLFTVGAVASVVPAMRAATVDPVRVLKTE